MVLVGSGSISKKAFPLLGARGALARTERAARRFRLIKSYLAFEKYRLWLGRARAPALPVASSPTHQIEPVPPSFISSRAQHEGLCVPSLTSCKRCCMTGILTPPQQ